jgi:hypothetical protein
MLLEEEVKEFQVIYNAYYGKEINAKDAAVELQTLISFVRGVHEHLRKPEVQALLRCVLEEERVQREKSTAESKPDCSS